MLKMLHQYAAGFQSHGVKPGDKVLVHVDDSLESFIAMYGVVFAGGVVIPSELDSEQDKTNREVGTRESRCLESRASTDPELRRGRLHLRCSVSSVTTDPSHGGYAQVVQQGHAPLKVAVATQTSFLYYGKPQQSPTPKLKIQLSGRAVSPGGSTASSSKTTTPTAPTGQQSVPERFVVGDKPGFISVTNFKNVPEESFIDLPEVDVEKELIALCFTSGTTGRPKAVEETHYSCVAGLQLYRLNMMFDETETVGVLFAVTQTVGLRMIMRIVCSGATCVVISQGTSFDEMVDIVRRHKITTLFSSTTAIHLLATHVVESGIRLSSVRNVVVIAVRVTEKAVETMFSAFCLKSFRSMYGTTELSNVISWMPRDTMEHRTIGFPAPDVQMKVANSVGAGQEPAKEPLSISPSDDGQDPLDPGGVFGQTDDLFLHFGGGQTLSAGSGRWGRRTLWRWGAGFTAERRHWGGRASEVLLDVARAFVVPWARIARVEPAQPQLSVGASTVNVAGFTTVIAQRASVGGPPDVRLPRCRLLWVDVRRLPRC
ncbi:hypothetical protein HPB47_009395 [Ixodes persulcatus]|uniref:Uncharacterized protein n=1 Tax=Ixodes persulcatus TaxID=34615 RepID=A0AC60P1Z6_IXOPE|nr:hypothetical protein HPB47_009395 [Ixodes persulcatus]